MVLIYAGGGEIANKKWKTISYFKFMGLGDNISLFPQAQRNKLSITYVVCFPVSFMQLRFS